MRNNNTCILCIEDDRFIRKFALRQLKLAGYDVVAVAGPTEGLREAETKKIDLALLELDTLDGDGLANMRRFRIEHPATPVIVMTEAGAFTQAKAIRMGAAACLHHSHLERRRLDQTIHRVLHLDD